MTLPFLWPPRSPARQCDANSDQTKDHRRAVSIAEKTFRRVGVSCPPGTKRLSESCIAPIVAHARPATRGTEDTTMSHRAAMTSALLLVMSLSAAFAADQRVWDECNQNGDADASIAACTQILQAHDETTSNRAIAYYVRAGAYKTKGDNDHAIVDYTKAIEANAQYADAYASRGIVYQIKGDNDHAIADYTKAIEIDPRNANAFVGRGMVYRLRGDSDHAVADYTQAIEINPRSANGYLNRGSIFEATGERDRAIADFSKAIDLAPRDAEAHVRRGIIYQATGNGDGAIADYSKAIEIDPRQAEAYLRRGIAYRDIGDGDSAILDYGKAIEINGRDAVAYLNRGSALEAKGDHDLAKADYSKAIEINPHDAKAYYGRAVAMLHIGNRDAAIADYTKAIEISPEFAVDLAKWWNTRGQLGRLGTAAVRRGFPRTHYFAQARSVFAVAANRCREVFDPPESVTLWQLPETVEEEFGSRWERWLEQADEWRPFFQELENLKDSNLGPAD
jgi:tetratricopeptide (TPR) repeat protein